MVLNDDFSVDEKKTKALRGRMAKQRGKPNIFDFGGSIEQLKANCEKETGHAAPRQPEFQSWALETVKKSRKKAAGGR